MKFKLIINIYHKELYVQNPYNFMIVRVLYGAPGTTRTCGQPLRRRLLYPLSYRRIYYINVERVMGIEPTQSAWKADVLPLNYTRTGHFFRDLYYYTS
jgi:hypothetical protein